ncbi:1,4-dihydroxy-2-naphthoate polyprenyltransferase [Xanthovirga aplysinae]|uniref:1,4-dihydroxy-2-naphthoate polyprenyltransferase n=1 Tax=Xanthovirga aplysinae TaxID=2529853 RepID=UPI0012BD4395|nr:1,4-dihydroxy-2-naphthoate polyprenyltransferase [Xanthovirga aplysinae]MTI33078.1 1,4-dihydroxy-2-naphthoate polyprenyltransferase [Xanthovirga aplysinae]
MESKTKIWIKAFRLRTLPLALASIGMGSFLAAAEGKFNGAIFSLCALTTIFLQILSNLANDYGDSVHGADNKDRKGPIRTVQSGQISHGQMKTSIFIFSGLSLISGLGLIYISVGLNLQVFLFFLGLGIMSIIAAITYTSGKIPYGYKGLGDISVLIFFGLVGVMGSYYLYAFTLPLSFFLPALSCGLFSTAVLNLNNIRDIESDKKAGKFSIPVRIGRKNAVIYHWALLLGGLSCALLFVVLNFQSYYQLIFLGTLPLLLRNGKAVSHQKDSLKLDPYLKQMALTTLLFAITFGLGMLIS